MLEGIQGDNQNTALEVGFRSLFQGVGVLCGSGVRVGQKDAGVWGRSESKWFSRTGSGCSLWTSQLCCLLGSVHDLLALHGFTVHDDCSVIKHQLSTSVLVHEDIQIFQSLLPNPQALAVLHPSLKAPTGPTIPWNLADNLLCTSYDPPLLLAYQRQWGKGTVLRRSSFIHLPTKSSYFEEGTSPLSMSLWDKLPWDLCLSGKTNCNS